jgi:hypothetical protein
MAWVELATVKAKATAISLIIVFLQSVGSGSLARAQCAFAVSKR